MAKMRKFILLIISLISSYLMAQDSHLYLYEPNKNIKLEEIISILEKDGFDFCYPKFNDDDTLVIYQKDYQTIHVGYCSTSKLIFNYKCEWCFDPSLKDSFSLSSENFKNKKSDSFINLSKWYFMSVRDSLNHKYGNPRYIYSHEGYGYTIIDDKNKLDTLNYNNLFNNHCFFELFWIKKDIRVTLGFDNTSEHSIIKYSYYDNTNHRIKNEELIAKRGKTELIETAKWTVIALLILLTLFFIGKRIYEAQKETLEERKRQEKERERQLQLKAKEEIAKQKQINEQRKLLVANHNNYVASLVEKYGKCDKAINYNQQRPDIFNEILVFSHSKIVVIDKKEYPFSDVLDCIVNDDIKEIETVQTFRGNSTATSKTNTGNMIGRTIAGGVLLGGAGAIIGGSTAKRNTVIEHGTDTSIHNKEVEHNYTVAITVKDISNPVLYLNVGSNTGLKDEIVSLIKVIMSMK